VFGPVWVTTVAKPGLHSGTVAHVNPFIHSCKGGGGPASDAVPAGDFVSICRRFCTMKRVTCFTTPGNKWMSSG
jgi:hypothetical protein